MKSLHRLSMLSCIVCNLLLSAAYAATQATLYVSPTGSGTVFSQSQPGSLSSVQSYVRTLTPSMSGDIVVNMRGGRYGLSSTFTLSASDGGSGNNHVIYQAYLGEKPVISGGIPVTGWTVHDAAKNIYKATVGTTVDSRQLYVNGVRAVRARSVNSSGWSESGDGYNCPAAVATWGNLTNVEVVSYEWWKCNRGPIALVSGTHAVMANPYWTNTHVQAAAPPAWVENAYELLDAEGEWYLNRATGILFYKPKTGESMSTAEIILAKVEKLISGSSVNNLQFDGITFSHSTWLRPNTTQGHPCWQADYLQGQYVMPGDLTFDHTANLVIQNCTFEHLGSTALLLNDGCKNSRIYNNVFQDVSGTGIAIGNLKVRSPSAADLVKDNTIDNNLIQYVAAEYKGCVGILGAYIDQTLITHNHLRQLPYSGISVGWGWTTSTTALKNNIISYNRIDTAMSQVGIGDGGSIYTLSKQPGSRVEFNYVNMVYRDYTYGLYADQGTSNMRWQNNVLKDCAHWLDIWTSSIQYDTVTYNYYSNNCGYRYEGTNCVIENNTAVANYNWPAAALTIIANAGRIQTSTSVNPAQNITYKANAHKKTGSQIYSVNGKFISQSVKNHRMKSGIYFVKSSDNVAEKKLLIAH